MYYIDVQKGWEMENHTQSAVNNFLGMHRYDACFKLKWVHGQGTKLALPTAMFSPGNILSKTVATAKH